VFGTGQDFQLAQVDSRRLNIACFQDDSHTVVALSNATVRGDPPAAVHLHVRVDTGRADADEQMLSAAENLADCFSRQVHRREPGHAYVTTGQRLADQPVAQVGRRVPHRVALRHGRYRRSRRPRGVRTKPAPESAAATSARSPDCAGSSTGTPSTLSTRIPATRSLATNSASAPAAARWASASDEKLSSERPPRSRNHTNSPSTRTTSAPALRPGR